ncbi:MAG: hypothetical protein ACOX6V_00095 [Patescibacteria group bacterium]|jgi:A/G-specific adenine glycosylase
MAFIFNEPTVVIETNIRTVYIHYFFKIIVNVNDKDILQLIEETLDYNNPRIWYYAHVDYGARLKRLSATLYRRVLATSPNRLLLVQIDKSVDIFSDY